MSQRAICRQSAAQQIAFYSITLVGGDQLRWGLHVFATHSLRRTEATPIYHRTRNLRAIQMLLGHRKIEITVRLHGQRSQDVRSFSSIREDSARFNFDTANDADSRRTIHQFGVVNAGRYASDRQPLVGIDGTVRIAFALVRTPV